jgi:hypothetical protein
MIRRLVGLLLASAVVAVGALGAAGTAAAAPPSTTIATPSPYPWEAPIPLFFNGYSTALSVAGGPYVPKLGISVAPPTTDPIYSQQFRLLTYSSHTEINWRNTATGATGTVFSDEGGRYPSASALIDTGLGWVDYTVVITTGAFVPQLNPQTLTVSGSVEVVPYPY